MKRRLPVLVEHTLGTLDSTRLSIAKAFESTALKGAIEARRTISCRPGCSNCCYHPVSISVLEGILVYRHLQQEGLLTAELRQSLREASDRQIGASYEVWLLSLTACPLLDEQQRCRAYAARPLICRTYLATSDPHYCHPHRLGPDTRLANRDAVTTEFHEVEKKLMRGHRLRHLLAPIGIAILIGERICQGKISLSDADKELIGEFVGKA